MPTAKAMQLPLFPTLLPPRSDLVFKQLFGKESAKRSLIAMLNAVLELQGDERIVDVEYLNPITLGQTTVDKESILDLKARDQKGRLYNVEI